MSCGTCGCGDPRRPESSGPPLESRHLRLFVLLFALFLVSLAAVQRWHTYLSSRAEGVDPGAGVFILASMGSEFDMTQALVSPERILSGGPPKDGIPSITSPEHIPPVELDLQDDARVIGVSIGEEDVAYPLALLNWHECVNDVVSGVPIAVTYCPLCDSVAVFDRRVGEDVLEFGISGRLYNSNVLLYDRRAQASQESLWSQLQGRAVTGPLVGTALETLPFDLTTWATWQAEYPGGMAAAFPDPPERDYGRDPYASYFADPAFIMFPVQPLDERREMKERILGLAASGEALAIPLRDLPTGEHHIAIAGQTVTFAWDGGAQALRVSDLPPGISAMHTFWFAWGAMHPDTTIETEE